MKNAEIILAALDAKLDQPAELTLFGRAAFALSYGNAPEEFARSKDIDAVLWLGQAEELLQTTNFWDAVAEVNQEFRDQELYISHLFEETQVVLTPEWREQRVRIDGSWARLEVYRLGDADLFLSKLMRLDPQDLADARFGIEQAGWNPRKVSDIIVSARVPDIPEIREQFALCAAAFLERLPGSSERIELESSAIMAVEYDRESQTLEMEFREGGKYRYFRVPLATYRDLLKAESAGAFWNEVKDDFTYARMA